MAKYLETRNAQRNEENKMQSGSRPDQQSASMTPDILAKQLGVNIADVPAHDSGFITNKDVRAYANKLREDVQKNKPVSGRVSEVKK